MNTSSMFVTRKLLCGTIYSSRSVLTRSGIVYRGYKKKGSDDGCRRACVDIPPERNPVCPEPCNRWGKRKEGILHRIKLKIIEGGTNFGTPFRRIQCKEKVCKEIEVSEPKALPGPSIKAPALPPPRPGVQVSILGADTKLGQYIALLLKQCPCIKKLRLYAATDTQCSDCSRELCQVVQDIQHIDTNCSVQAFSCVCNELEKCLQNSDIVLLLESGCMNMEMPLETRFYNQAPIIKQYADAIAKECPNAFIVVCASPIDCMVPLIAATMRETGWYNPRKLLGSLAVPEMRASTLAARGLCLEPSYVHVQCIGGTEGASLVPLFSRALEYFDFNEQNSEMMTRAVRCASNAVSRCEGNCTKSSELSEAHALTGLVTKIAWALLCKDVPRVSGFVDIDRWQIMSPNRFIANTVEITGTGIVKNMGLPKMSDIEVTRVDVAINELNYKLKMVEDWYCKFFSSSGNLNAYQLHFFPTKPFDRFDDCAYATI